MPERMISIVVSYSKFGETFLSIIKKGFISDKIVNKIKVSWGPPGVKSPILNTMMDDGILDEHTLEQMIINRFAEFLYNQIRIYVVISAACTTFSCR